MINNGRTISISIIHFLLYCTMRSERKRDRERERGSRCESSESQLQTAAERTKYVDAGFLALLLFQSVRVTTILLAFFNTRGSSTYYLSTYYTSGAHHDEYFFAIKCKFHILTLHVHLQCCIACSGRWYNRFSQLKIYFFSLH